MVAQGAGGRRSNRTRTSEGGRRLLGDFFITPIEVQKERGKPVGGVHVHSSVVSEKKGRGERNCNRRLPPVPPGNLDRGGGSEIRRRGGVRNGFHGRASDESGGGVIKRST